MKDPMLAKVTALRARFVKAQTYGHAIAKASLYAQKLGGVGDTPAELIALCDNYLAYLSAGPVIAKTEEPAPPPVAPPAPAVPEAEADSVSMMLEEGTVEPDFAEASGAEEPAAPELDELDPLEGRGR